MNWKKELEAALSRPAPTLFGSGQPVEEPTRLWRIEMPNGFGPYNSHLPEGEEIYWRLCYPAELGGYNCAQLARDNAEQMGISEEAFYTAHGDASYACDSEEALHKWFPKGARRYLAGLGAKLVEYEVPTGGHIERTGALGEVVFAKPEAHKVAEKALA